MTTHAHQPEHWPTDDFVSTEELIRRHGATPIKSVGDLAPSEDPFETDEEHEAFLTDLYASRRADIA